LDTDSKEQLLIYQLAASQQLGEKVEKLTYYYLEENSRVSFVGSEKDLENLKKKIVDTIAEIKNYDWPPRVTDCQCQNQSLDTLS
jgi:CRISPR/Cas system-associated exonuclease Cas4 (RecB family)